MKKAIVVLLATIVALCAITTAWAAVEDSSVTQLSENMFIIVQPIDGGNMVEVFELRSGKLYVIDSLRYVRKSAIGGGYEIEVERVEKIKEKK